MKTTQAWGWLAAGVLALGLNGIYQDGGAAWAHRVLNGTMGRFAARSGAVLALATGRVDWFAEKVSAPTTETASCRVASAWSRMRSRISRARGGSRDFVVTTASQDAAMARMDAQSDRMEALRDRMEAQVARVELAPVAFNTIRIPDAACQRVRVRVPRVNIPRTPMVRIAAPMEIELSNGPI